jgi:hypothetical protein
LQPNTGTVECGVGLGGSVVKIGRCYQNVLWCDTRCGRLYY